MTTENARWNFFDARCTVGRHVLLHEGDPHTASDLLDVYERLLNVRNCI